MLAFFFLFSFLCVEPIWHEIRGPLRDFLNADGNRATDYLKDGVNWYQMKIKLHGIHYYIPLSIQSDKMHYAQKLEEPPRYKWTLTLPVNDIRTEESKYRRSNQELNKTYGSPDVVEKYSAHSCMSITKHGNEIRADINWVHANKYYSGSEIMAIFMTIATRKNITFSRVGLTDTSSKICHKLLGSPYVHIVYALICRFNATTQISRQCVATHIYGFFRPL